MNPDFDGDKPYGSSNFKSGSHTSAQNLWKDASYVGIHKNRREPVCSSWAIDVLKSQRMAANSASQSGDNAIPRGKCGPKLVDSAAKYDEWSSSDPISLHYTPLGEEQ